MHSPGLQQEPHWTTPAPKHPLEWLQLERPTTPSVGEDIERQELSSTADMNVKQYNHLGKQSTLPSTPDLPLLGIYLGAKKHVATTRLVYKSS